MLVKIFQLRKFHWILGKVSIGVGVIIKWPFSGRAKKYSSGKEGSVSKCLIEEG